MGRHEVVSAVLEEEARVLLYYRTILSEANEPELGVLLTRLYTLRLQQLRELEDFRQSLDATGQITQQINEMFL